MSQTYPIGRDNLNQLIQLQLGTEAFDIIHKVADNMETLKKAIALFDQMSEIKGIVDMEARLTVLQTRLDTLESSVQNRLSTLESTVNGRVDTLENTVYGRLSTLENAVNDVLYILENTVYDRLYMLESTVYGRVDTLEGTVQAISISIEDLTAKVTALENKP